MNERDIELAKQAGLKTYQEQAPGLDGMVGSWEAIEAFTELVRADEREACAKVCEDYTGQDYDTVSDLLAEAIRARGECMTVSNTKNEPIVFTENLVIPAGADSLYKNAAEGGSYFSKPKREWVGLTEGQFVEAIRLAEAGNYLVAFQRIQQWLKEKNK